MVRTCFDEIIKEASNGEVHIWDYDDNELVEFIYRTAFNTVFNEDSVVNNDYLTIKIDNIDSTIKLLEQYVYLVLTLYNIDINYHTVKKVITLLFSNITLEDSNNINMFIMKYINFLLDNTFERNVIDKDINYMGIGNLQGEVKLQSLKLETPYAFYSHFENIINGKKVVYPLPRISFGIQNNKCYIYAIQNHDKNIDNSDEQVRYNVMVKDALRTLNHSIKKYRNVSPSFILSLTFLLSALKDNGISQYEVVSGLPIRMKNRELVNDYKIKVKTKKGQLTGDNINILKQSLEDERVRIDYNSTEKFKNHFHRLKIHFDGAINFKDALNDCLQFDLYELQSTNLLLQEVVATCKNNMIK